MVEVAVKPQTREQGPKTPTAIPTEKGKQTPTPTQEQLGKRIQTETAKAVVEPDKIAAEIAGEAQASPHLIVDLSEANLARLDRLRDPAVVGKEQYGDSLFNLHIYKKGHSVAENEQLQAVAYNALQERIDKGLVDPSAIGTEMVRELKVSPEVTDVPKTHDGMPSRVNQELTTFVEQGFITTQEAAVIQAEVVKFSQLYHEAYPDADVVKAYELVRDNARKLTYQTKRDKQVFVGSDHGIKHILQGDMRFADQMIAGLEEQGMTISAKDKILIRQTIIDHDCGYTCGCAQAPKGFEGSKDHPNFSARFVEANRGYYEDKFGQEGYSIIQRSVLYHNYPPDLPQQLAQGDMHYELVRSISSTVDALGVTAETKTPLFFTSPDSIRVLLKIKLAMETGQISDQSMGRYKKELEEVAGREGNPDRRGGYFNAITNFFNEKTAELSLGHYTGVVDKVGVVRRDGKLIPQVDLRMSRIHALLGDMFGGELEAQAFKKAMGDFGMNEREMGQFGSTLQEARRSGVTPSPEQLVYDSPKARFVLNPQLAEYATDEFASVRQVVEEAYKVSIRTEVNRLLDTLEGREVSSTIVAGIQEEFLASISSKTTETDRMSIIGLTSDLADESLSGKIREDGKPTTKAEEARKALRVFLTQQEKEFLGI